MEPADVGPMAALQFGVELGTLASLGYWGYARPVAGVPPPVVALGMVVGVAGLWWLLAAPRAPYRLETPLLTAFQAGVVAAGVLALADLGFPLAAAGLAGAGAVALVGTGR
jgi:hypothetical protein